MLRRLVAVGLALAFTAMPLAPAHATVVAPAGERAPAAVLGIDTDEVVLGARLTGALRRAFAARGFSGGEEAELSEVRLALDCAADEPVCLAGGGPMLGARRLIYGQLRPISSGNWRLDLWILETESVTLEEHQKFKFPGKKLSPSGVDALAEQIVAKMLAGEQYASPGGTEGDNSSSNSDAVAEESQRSDTEARVEDEPAPQDKGQRKGAWFGLERPTPRWKWAFLGTSAGLMVVSGGATIGIAIWLTGANIGFRKKLLEEAEASLQDDNPYNDVDPNLPEGINLCEFAETRPTDPDTEEPLGETGQVRNARIVKLCGESDQVRKVQLGTGIGVALFGVSTLVSLGMLLIHRGPRPKSEFQAWRRHRMTLGVGGTPGRGIGLSLRGRF